MVEGLYIIIRQLCYETKTYFLILENLLASWWRGKCNRSLTSTSAEDIDGLLSTI